MNDNCKGCANNEEGRCMILYPLPEKDTAGNCTSYEGDDNDS